MTTLSKRIQSMQPSGTAAVFEAAAKLRASGVPVLTLSLGEPDFPTPPHIIEATKTALDAGMTRYTLVAGLASLREAICEDSRRRRGVSHTPDQVVVTAGAKHALFNLANALLDPGDRVVIPTPCWGSYVEQARLCGADVALLETRAEEGFFPTPEELEAALRPGAKAVVLCAPSNPTGAVPGRSQLEALADVLRHSEAHVIIDEIYGRLTYDVSELSLLTVAPDLTDRVTIVDGVSKTFAMTGFRIGWALTNPTLARALTTLQGQETTNVATMAQCAAEAALCGDQACVDSMVEEFAARRDLLCDALSQVEGLRVPLRPLGAFYVFVDVRDWLSDALPDDVALAHHLLDRVQLSVVPGSAFFAPAYLRLSYAASRADLLEAVARLRQVAADL